MAIGRLNIGLTGVQPGGLAKVIPSSVAVGSGTGSTDTNGTVTFTNATSVSLNDVFSTNYDRYKIFIQIDTCDGDTTISFRTRVSGSDLTTETYKWVYNNTTSSGTTDLGGATSGVNASNIRLGLLGNASPGGFAVCDVMNPFLTKYTYVSSNYLGNRVPMYGCSSTGFVNNTTSYTGFTIYNPTVNNMTGVIKVYGYNN